MNKLPQIVRGFVLQLVAVVTLLAQFHVCSQVLEHHDGRICDVVHAGSQSLDAVLVDHTHGQDCEIHACHDSAPTLVASNGGVREISLEPIILPSNPPELCVWVVEREVITSCSIKASPPTGCSLLRSSRAPPVVLQSA